MNNYNVRKPHFLFPEIPIKKVIQNSVSGGVGGGGRERERGCPFSQLNVFKVKYKGILELKSLVQNYAK